MKEFPNCKTMLEDDELFCHECGAKQEIEETEAQNEGVAAPLDKKCIHCGKTIEEDSAFCPYCGQSLKESLLESSDELILSDEITLGKPMAGIRELLELHINCVKENPGKEVKTTIYLIGSSLYEMIIYSNAKQKLVFSVSFDLAKKSDKQAYDRFKSGKFDSIFVSKSDITDSYHGEIVFSDLSEKAILILSGLIASVYKITETSSNIKFYSKVVGDVGKRYRIESGVPVETKGCMSVVVVFIVLGITLMCLL